MISLECTRDNVPIGSYRIGCILPNPDPNNVSVWFCEALNADGVRIAYSEFGALEHEPVLSRLLAYALTVTYHNED